MAASKRRRRKSPDMKALKELAVFSSFRATPPTIRVSREMLIGERVKPDVVGIQKFLQPFALINCLKLTGPYGWWSRNWVTDKCNNDFLRWCIENSITQLELGEHGARLSADALLDYCFGPHGSDSDPRHLQARFMYSVDFIARLLEANRKCSRKGAITMDIMAWPDGSPNLAELAPYKVEETRQNRPTFLLQEDFDFKIICSDHHRGRFEIYRPAQPR